MLFIFQIMDYINKNLVDVLLIASIIFVFLIVITLNLNRVEPMTLNKLDNQFSKLSDNELDSFIRENKYSNKHVDASNTFCNKNSNSSENLHEKCAKLSGNVCKKTGCCVYLNNESCVAGDKSGPTYLSDDNGNNINIDQYYYMNKCYGKKCN